MTNMLLPPASEVWGKVIFLHLFVILFTGGGRPQCMLGCPLGPGRHPLDHAPPGTMHPPDQVDTLLGPGRPPGTMHPPRTMHPPGPGRPPQEQADPPGPGRHPPAQSMLGNTVNAWVVRILLECNLVSLSFCIVVHVCK